MTRDIPSNTVAGGVPAHFIKEFDAFVEKRKGIAKRGDSVENLWDKFHFQRKTK